MIRARFSPKAERDLDGIFRFISSDNPGAAQRVREPILDVADFLAQNPELGRKIRNASPRHAQVRWFVVPKFRNYLIFYQPFQETVMVVRILHAAQDWTCFFPQNPQV
jgi:plasmid stabilization system protein ParE